MPFILSEYNMNTHIGRHLLVVSHYQNCFSLFYLYVSNLYIFVSMTFIIGCFSRMLASITNFTTDYNKILNIMTIKMFVIDDSIACLEKKIITMRITCQKVILVIGSNNKVLDASGDWHGIK